jgi:cephalosporin hydroxylase
VKQNDHAEYFQTLFRLRGRVRQLRDVVYGRLNSTLRKQRIEMLANATPLRLYEFVMNTVPPLQIKSELFALADYLDEIQPQVFCEIGVADGGTNFFLARRCCSIRQVIGIDVHIKNAHIIRDLARPDCLVTLIDGSSDWESVRKSVKRALRGKRIDVLLIDGDHSYKGVRSDFVLYRDYVRDGGIIVFHDIVKDYGARFGKRTLRYTGGVPQFFQEISGYYRHRTFVEDIEQDGFGIGCIEYRRDTNDGIY